MIHLSEWFYIFHVDREKSAMILPAMKNYFFHPLALGLVLWCSAGPSFAKDPKELRDLCKVQATLDQKALSTARVKFLAELKRMSEGYIRAGKLEEASAARRQLAYTVLGGNWYVVMDGKPTEWLCIFPDATAVTIGSNTHGTWEAEPDGGLKITWSNTTSWTINLPTREPDAPTGKGSAGGSFRLEREKPASAEK